MDLNFTDVIAVFDIGRTWKRFRLFDRSLNPVHTEERIIAEARDEKAAQRLLNEYKKKVEAWKKELA